MKPRPESIEALRIEMIGCLLGHPSGSDRLIQLELDALLAGVESPSLALLAGLTRAEEPEALQLFGRVTHELGLAPNALPEHPVAREWALVLWPTRLMVDGVLGVHRAGDLIYWRIDRFFHAGDQDARKLLTAIVIHDDTVTSWAIWDDGYAARYAQAESGVLEAARNCWPAKNPRDELRGRLRRADEVVCTFVKVNAP